MRLPGHPVAAQPPLPALPVDAALMPLPMVAGMRLRSVNVTEPSERGFWESSVRARSCGSTPVGSGTVGSFSPTKPGD